MDAPQAAGEHRLEPHGLAEGTVQELRHAGDETIDVDHLRGERLLARKGKQPLGQLGGTPGRVTGRIEELADVGHPGCHPPLGKVDGADDHREHVVEIVGDPAGELADGLDLLHLPDLALRRQPRLHLLGEPGIRLAKELVPLADRGRVLRKLAIAAPGVADRKGTQPGNDQRRSDDPDEQVARRPVRGVERGLPRRDLAFLDRGDQPPHIVHQRLATVAADDRDRLVPLAGTIEIDRVRHFCQLGIDELVEPRDVARDLRVRDALLESCQALGEPERTVHIGFEVSLVAGEQVAALPGLGILERAQHLAHADDRAEPRVHLPAVVTDAEGERGDGNDDGDDQQEPAEQEQHRRLSQQRSRRAGRRGIRQAVRHRRPLTSKRRT